MFSFSFRYSCCVASGSSIRGRHAVHITCGGGMPGLRAEAERHERTSWGSAVGAVGAASRRVSPSPSPSTPQSLPTLPARVKTRKCKSSDNLALRGPSLMLQCATRPHTCYATRPLQKTRRQASTYKYYRTYKYLQIPTNTTVLPVYLTCLLI